MSSAQQENSSAQLAILFKNACLAELEALKPGNVHIFADGHGMVVQDFIKSAEAASMVIAEQSLTVGERILRAVSATWAAVNCNTNLGIILLCAPLIQAISSLKTSQQFDVAMLRKELSIVLNTLTIEDAALAYQAIAKAKPAGLGEVSQHDVSNKPTITLLEAMQVSAPRDLVAQQYANQFAEVFEFGLPIYQAALNRWQKPAWAASALYLSYLASFPDTHISRKHGAQAAEHVQEEAKLHEAALVSHENPKLYMAKLLAFDAQLKSSKLNPGTSADLTVATIFTHGLITHQYKL